jgi:hypothetical protein
MQMSSDIGIALQDLVKLNVISTAQVPEITSMFTEMQKNWQSNDARKLFEPLRSSVPPSWLKVGYLTYEDAWLLGMAVMASNTKRAYDAANVDQMSKMFSNAFFQPKGE